MTSRRKGSASGKNDPGQPDLFSDSPGPEPVKDQFSRTLSQSELKALAARLTGDAEEGEVDPFATWEASRLEGKDRPRRDTEPGS